MVAQTMKIRPSTKSLPEYSADRSASYRQPALRLVSRWQKDTRLALMRKDITEWEY